MVKQTPLEQSPDSPVEKVPHDLLLLSSCECGVKIAQNAFLTLSSPESLCGMKKGT